MAGLSLVGIPEERPDATAPDVYQRAKPNAAPAGAFGERTAEGLSAVGAGISKTAAFYSEAATDDQTNELFDRWNKRLRGDPNQMVAGPDGQQVPDTGYMGLKGRNALDARPGFEKSLDADLKEIRSNLSTPEQQNRFDQQSRHYRQHVQELAASHADGQANEWYKNVNKASSDIALTHISNNAENVNEVRNGMSDLIRSRIKSAQILGGGPELLQQAEEGARRDGTKAWLEAIATNKPAMALTLLEKNRNDVGPLYDNLAKEFRTRAYHQEGQQVGEEELLKTYKAIPPAAQVLPVLESAGAPYGISGSFLSRVQQLETGDKPNQVSSAGAKGPFQVMDKTAQQYGLADPFDYAKSADTTARLAADNKAALGARLGRSPTDAELYLAHQQGATGAFKLLANPGIRAGDLVGDKKITQNGGDPNAPASDFTTMWTTKFGGAGAVPSLAARKSDAYQGIMARTDLTPEVRQLALQHVNQTILAQQVAMDATEKAQKQESEKTKGDLIAQMYSDDPKVKGSVTPQRIATMPGLLPADRENMIKFLETSLKEPPAPYISSANTVKLFERMNLPFGNPAKITDLNPINDAFTRQEISKADFDWASKRFTEQKSADGERFSDARKRFLDGVKTKITKYDINTGFTDTDAPLRLYRFQWELDRKVDRMRKDGKDPTDLMDPASKDFMGSDEALKPYVADMNKFFQSHFEASPAGAAETFDAAKIKSAEEVKAAYIAKKITKDEATKILVDRFNYAPPRPQVPRQ